MTASATRCGLPRALALGCWLMAALVGCGMQPARDILGAFRIPTSHAQLGHPTWLADATADELAGSLSPNGKRVLYASNSKGQFDIWVKDLTTGLPARLTRDMAEDTQPSWGPRGKTVAFVSRREDAKGDIYLWSKGNLRRLTDSRTAEAYPVFGPDGTLYFASGAIGRTRIERIGPGGKRRRAISDWNATHPALSHDGRYLAYTWFDSRQRGRIRLKRLHDGREWTVTAPDYHAGFPTFSADGAQLLFCRFFRGAPHAPRDPDAVASLWRLPLARVIAGESAERLAERSEQLTSDRRGVLLPRAHARGTVLTVQRIGGLDIGLIPSGGLAPRGRDGAALWRLAHDQPNPWDALFLLRHLRRRSATHVARALHREAQLFTALGELDKAEQALGALVREHGASSESQLARIDRVTLPVERARRAGQPLAAKQRAKATLEPLALRVNDGAARDRVRAYALLRLGEMQQLAGKHGAAIASLARLQQQFRGERDLAARAQLRLGELLAPLRTPTMLADYYLSIFDAYPRQTAVLRQAATAALAQWGGPPAEQIAQIRRLVDGHADKRLFCALAAQRLAVLHQRRGAPKLAIRALDRGIQHSGQTDELTAELAFELGRLSTEVAAKLRAASRAGEALTFYERALAAYERLVRHFEPGSETHQRARRAYLRLSLLDAAQQRRQGEHTLARKRYGSLLAFDGELLQAHRGLARLAVAQQLGGSQGQDDQPLGTAGASTDLAALAQRYSGHPSRFVRLYMQGYLATLRQPLEAADLARAEGLLRQASALRPQSPFPQLTLGWVYEMRERYLGRTERGWLEEAVLAYNRAYQLNDSQLDPQTEADLLLNLANGFVALGSGWDEVLGFCRRRRELAYPFDSKAQEATHQLTCGRASSARAKYDQAARQLERALRLARELGKARLETETLARLAVNEHLRGDYGSSSRLLERMRAQLLASNQPRNLAAIERTLAYNALLANDHPRALALLERAAKTLREHGAPTIPSYEAVATGPLPSTLPLGLTQLAEDYAQHGLREIVQHNRQRWDEALAEQAAAVRLLRRRSNTEAFDELQRELLVTRNRYALSAARLDDMELFWQQLEAALAQATALRSQSATINPQTLQLEVGLALNASEQLLGALQRGKPSPPGRLEALQQRLERLDEIDAEAEAAGAAPLSERLRLGLWSALAQLGAQRALLLAGSRPADAPPVTQGAPEASAGAVQPPAANGAGRALSQLLERSRPLSAALEQLQRVVDQTAPGMGTDETANPDSSYGRALSAPLTPLERRRWHVLSSLNLARLATTWVEPARLAQHSTTRQLEQLAATSGTTEQVGVLAELLAGELAYRRGDGEALGQATRRFVGRHPLLLDSDELQLVDQARRQLFGRALALALRQDRAAEALRLAEVAERHAFVVALVRLGPRGGPKPARRRLRQLLERASSYRALLSSSATEAGPDDTKAEGAPRLAQAAQRVRDELDRLQAEAPTVARLLQIGEFPLDNLRALLSMDERLVRAVHDGARVALIVVGSAGEPRMAALDADLRALRTGQSAAAVLAQVEQALRPLKLQAKRLYVDLGAIDPALTDAFVAPEASVVRLASAWELLDARRHRDVAIGNRIVIAGGSSGGGSTGDSQPQADPPVVRLPPTSLTMARLEQATERSGALLLQRPVRFAGGSPANMLFALGSGTAAARDFRPARRLGQPLRTSLLVLPDVTFGPTRKRAQRVALLRLLHALGIPSVALAAPGSNAARIGASDLDGLARAPLAEAMQGAGLLLFGDGGVAPSTREGLATQELKRTVFAGARAFNAKPRQLANTITLLETARRYMGFVGQSKYLGGALLYLANAYGLQQDYGRAIRRMKQLVALRASELAEHEQAKADRRVQLKAKAELVTALRQMAWLRLRNGQHDAALAANARSIAIYRQVGRKLLLRAAFEQRSIINEKQGNFAEALRFARQSLAIARNRAGRAKAPTATRLLAAREATRVALLQRLRFSRFDAALRSVREALALAPTPHPGQLARLRGEQAQLERQSKGLAGARATIDKRLERTKAAVAAAEQLLTTRRDALLELARTHTARGTFSEAVEIAERTATMLREAGLPTDGAELELVNNLYYMGAYRRALAVAKQGLARGKLEPQRTIQFLNAQGTAMAALGRYEPSLATLRRALRIARRQRISREIAATLNNIGNTLRLAGRQHEARRSFGAALALDEADDDKLGMSFSLANRGLTQSALDLTTEAEQDMRRAYELARQIGAPLNQLKALAGLSRLAARQRQHAVALQRAERGLAIARGLGLRNWTWRFELQAGRALLALGRRAAARRRFRRGVQTVDTRPARPPAAGGATQGEEQPREIYEELIELLAADGDAAGALQLVQRLHARAFTDLNSGELEQVGDAGTRQLLSRIVRLQGEREAARSASLRAPKPSARLEVETAVAQSGQQLDQARQRLRQLNGQLLALVEPTVVPLPRLQSAVNELPADSAVAVFFATPRRLLIWLLRPTANDQPTTAPTGGQRRSAAPLQLISLDLRRRELRATVQLLRHRLQSFSPLGEARAKLSRWLVEPLLARSAAQRLYLLCGGFLRSVPFAALRVDGEPLIARRTIVQLSSLQDLLPRLHQQGAPPRSGGSRVGPGPTGQSWVSFSAANLATEPLPFSGYESAALGRSFDRVQVFQHDEASRQLFRSLVPQAAQLHLATHARLDARAPLRSSLRLGDGHIRLAEVLGLPLRARLVLLSACDTGLARGDGTEGVVGIDRGFLLAGAQGVISTIWRIDDLAAALLMKRLFRQLAAGQEAAQALRLAQLQLRKRRAHPAFWAAFRAMGPEFVLRSKCPADAASDRSAMEGCR